MANAPEALRQRIRQLTAAVASTSDNATALAGVARDTLQSVMRGPGDRSSALDLLAADALITLALLAQAKRDPGRLGEVAVDLLGTGSAGA